MSANIRGVFLFVLSVFTFAVILPDKPAVSQSIIPAEESTALRAAIKYLMSTFGDEYPNGSEFLTKLRDIESNGNKAEFESLQREALIANPLVSGRPILFVVRQQYMSDHHNTATLFKTGEINTNSFRGGGAQMSTSCSLRLS